MALRFRCVLKKTRLDWSFAAKRREFAAGNVASVEKRMQQWVDEFIVPHKICPFASKSRYEFRIYTGCQLDRQILDFVLRNVLEMGEDRCSTSLSSNAHKEERYNRFLVFPFIEEFTKGRYLSEFGEHFGGNVLFMSLSELLHSKDPSVPLERYYAAAAPFPTLHLLRNSDLNKVRKQKIGSEHMFDMCDDAPQITASVRQKNDKTFSNLGLDYIQDLFASFQEK
eukprot:CAMPEP_0202455928 /NCGR_PEP_ID=MMETSP1360-20130828/13331_1 /ASSEMBLY_ACC=CAM_ASM_000848 /TAXON_ID=515479 /ORGANISM="Licmophora paradoxa, Strain CCMP2313" /LENGTH=224 /DNA_ID=CAMNT_0049075621 /DNA_START=146 /DNA_END=820 /DNA_ORIENTATION=+